MVLWPQIRAPRRVFPGSRSSSKTLRVLVGMLADKTWNMVLFVNILWSPNCPQDPRQGSIGSFELGLQIIRTGTNSSANQIISICWDGNRDIATTNRIKSTERRGRKLQIGGRHKIINGWVVLLQKKITSMGITLQWARAISNKYSIIRSINAKNCHIVSIFDKSTTGMPTCIVNCKVAHLLIHAGKSIGSIIERVTVTDYGGQFL